MKDDIHKYRVLNLIEKVDLSTASVKKWAVIKLLDWQNAGSREVWRRKFGIPAGQ